MRKFGGIGFVMLLVVLAVVLLLVAKSWKSVAPTAAQIPADGPAGPLETHGEHEAGAELGAGALPDLNDMRAQTGAHADQLQEALEEIE